MVVAAAAIGYAAWVWLELIPLYRKRCWSDFWVNVVLGAGAFMLILLLGSGVEIKSPEKALRNLVISIFGK